MIVFAENGAELELAHGEGMRAHVVAVVLQQIESPNGERIRVEPARMQHAKIGDAIGQGQREGVAPRTAGSLWRRERTGVQRSVRPIGFFQGSLQYGRQHWLSHKVDRLIGQK